MISAFGLRGLGLIVQFIPPFVIAKTVDHQIAGIFFGYQAMITFCSVVFKFGLDDYFLKNYSERNFGIIRNSPLLYVAVALSVFVGIQLLSLLLYKRGDFSPYLTNLAAISGTALSLNSMVCAKFHGKLNYSRTIFHVNIIHNSLFVLFVVILSLNDLNELLNYYCLSLILGLLLAILDSIFFDSNQINGKLYKHDITPTFKDISTYAIVAVGPAYFPHGILYIASLELTSTQMTQLTLTLKLCHSAFGVLAIVNFYAAPVFARLHSSGETRLLKRTYRHLTLTTIGAASLISSVLYFYKFIEPIFLGLDLSVREFWWVWMGVMVNVSFGPIGYLSMMTGNQNINAIVSVVSVLISILILFIVGANRYEIFTLAVAGSYAIPKIWASVMLYQKLIER